MPRRRKRSSGKFQQCVGDALRGRKFGKRNKAREAFRLAVAKCK